MNKKEALEICLKVHNECIGHEDCFDCPFSEYYRGVKFCVVSHPEDKVITKLVEDKLKRISEAPVPKEDRAIKMLESSKPDNVNHPKHYLKGGLECIQVIKAQLTPEQYEGYLYGNVIKYMWRWKEKNGLEDLRKAAHYLMWLQEEVTTHG